MTVFNGDDPACPETPPDYIPTDELGKAQKDLACDLVADGKRRLQELIATPGATVAGEDSVSQTAESSRPRELLPEETLSSEQLQVQKAAGRDKQRFVKIRPKDSGPWCIVEPCMVDNMLDGAPRDEYEIVDTYMTMAEVEALGEFEGW
jgi:hypothetical protein